MARIALLALSALVLLVPPASAQRIAADDTVPLVSENVTPLATIPVGKPIGARFRGDHMFVTGTEGLTVYDVSRPELPLPVGALPLPHFENEDVDLGGDVLLISNDPSEGVGLLYVIDISDPTLPKLRSVMPNGLGDGQAQEVLEIFGLPPVEDAPATGIGHTASCVNADCTWAYLAGTSKGISIVDLRDRDAPRVAGGFVPETTGLATHDVQVDDEGTAWIAGADGTAGYDVSDPLNPVLVGRTDEAIRNSGQLGMPSLPDDPVFHFGDAFGGDGENPIDLIHHNSLQLGAGSPVYGIVEEDYTRPTCEGAGSFQTWGVSDQQTSTGARKLGLLDMYQTELSSLVSGRGWAPVTGLCSAHYFDHRDGIVAGGWYEEGTRFLDVSDPANIRQVGYWVPTKGETWSVLFPPTDPTGEIVYALDFARGIDVLRLDRSDLRTRSAPVRRSWLRGRGASDARTGLSRASRFGYVCRLAV